MERRDFLRSSAAAGPFLGRVAGANDRIVIGQIGLGAREHYELTLCLKNPGVVVAAVCDPYRPLVRHAGRLVGGAVKGYEDFRRVLERRDIEAVFVSTPDHWHAPISILACQAGKDVYCEKPLTHTIAEGRAMIEAAPRYKRVVQTGSQQRSTPHFDRVRDLFHGTLGAIFVDRAGFQVLPEMKSEGRRSDANMVAAMLASRGIKQGEVHLGSPAPAPAAMPLKAQCEPVQVSGVRIDPDYQIAHIKNWLEAIRSRGATAASFEVGHRAVTACHLGVIAHRLGRRIRWDAERETIPGDPEAQRMLSKTYRAPWAPPQV